MEFSLLWRFLSVCGFVQVACQGFLVREACVGVLVGGAGFLLSVGLAEVFPGMQCSSFPKGVDPKSNPFGKQLALYNWTEKSLGE